MPTDVIIELGENALIALIVTTILVGIFSVSAYGCHQVEETERTHSNNGLVQKQRAGTTSVYWTLPDEEETTTDEEH